MECGVCGECVCGVCGDGASATFLLLPLIQIRLVHQLLFILAVHQLLLVVRLSEPECR